MPIGEQGPEPFTPDEATEVRRPDRFDIAGFTGQSWVELEERGFTKIGDRWWVRPPGTESQFPIDSRWKLEEHDDGTISVSPSILVYGKGWTPENPVEAYHGYLRRGVWT